MERQISQKTKLLQEIEAHAKVVGECVLGFKGFMWLCGPKCCSRALDPMPPATSANEESIAYGDLSEHDLARVLGAFREARRNPVATMTIQEAARDDDLWRTLEAKHAGSPAALASLRRNRAYMERGLMPRVEPA